MKRCNQAWLIDHTNFNVYWCFGAVLGYKNNFKESAPYLEKALSIYTVSSEIFTNNYLKLSLDASYTFGVIADKYLATDQVNAKKYAGKTIDLLSAVLNDKNLPAEQKPRRSMELAYAYFNYGSHAEARKIYNDALNRYKYSEFDTTQLVEFDKSLKEKGF